MTPCPDFLHTSWLLKQFGSTPGRARQDYARFVDAGQGDQPWNRLTGQMYFGDEEFIETARGQAGEVSSENPRIQRQTVRLGLS